MRSSRGKLSRFGFLLFFFVDTRHVHVQEPSRQDAQPPVPWRHTVEGADKHTWPHTKRELPGTNRAQSRKLACHGRNSPALRDLVASFHNHGEMPKANFLALECLPASQRCDRPDDTQGRHSTVRVNSMCARASRGGGSGCSMFRFRPSTRTVPAQTGTAPR